MGGDMGRGVEARDLALWTPAGGNERTTVRIKLYHDCFKLAKHARESLYVLP